MKIPYRTVLVDIYHIKDGFRATLRLDTRCYDKIGFTNESLDKYMNDIILTKGQWYSSYKNKIRNL